ncbi:PDGLE domain-containing protein [uncultured Methanobrevibacter sp.]|uniref:PDGLE domain-containing protein n=1 Tax=uncultured Methanobrevibacter sp. TaxID=253161 RepID=UPI002612D5B9|nr:PDGLE domain-containing protein [uncultured Methanobrevibacter sp.]
MHLSKKDGYLILVAVIICIIISCLSPFIASGNPDGLEKSAEDAGLSEDYNVDGLNGIYSSPFPDYTFEPLGSIGEIGVLILGVVISLAVGLAIGKILKKRS